MVMVSINLLLNCFENSRKEVIESLIDEKREVLMQNSAAITPNTRYKSIQSELYYQVFGKKRLLFIWCLL